MRVPNIVVMAAIAAIAIAVAPGQAKADKLDDVINNGKLRCGVVLDFPPIGFRDANNNPVGFDVEYAANIRLVHGESGLHLAEGAWGARSHRAAQ